MNDDIQRMARDDIQKARSMTRGDSDWGAASYLEAAFGGLTGMVAIAWLISLWWVPDPISGGAWMGIGLLALALTGLPTGVLYLARRGGTELVIAAVRQLTR